MSATIAVSGVDVLDDLRILVAFSDGALKEIDLEPLMNDDAFAPIRDDRAMFEQAWLNPETRTVEWPGRISIGADVLYGRVEPGSEVHLRRRTLRGPRLPGVDRGTPRLIRAVPRTADYVVHLRFTDGTDADVDLGYLRHLSGVFAPFRDPEFFRRLRIYDHGDTIYWPNNSDIAPETLYAHARRSEELGRSAD